MAAPRTVDHRNLVEARWCGNEPCLRIKVENRVGAKGEAFISVSRNARVDALLGLAAGQFNLEINGTIALYASDGRLLHGTKTIDSVIKKDETIYLQRKQRGDEWLFRRNWCYWGAFLLVMSLAGVITFTCLYTLTGEKHPFKMGIVIDAGSSHSTAHIFKWDATKANNTGRVVEVKSVDGAEKKKGIDKLGPDGAYADLTIALERAKEEVVKASNNETSSEEVPVHLAATAGMRMLKLKDPEQATAVLYAAEAAIYNSGFQFKGAEISDGVDEGVDGWVALNYNKDRFALLKPTYGAMDMGGASLEVSAEISDAKSATRNLTLFGSDYHVFSQTHLCFGNDQAYFRYFMTLLLQADANNSTGFDKLAVDSPCHCNGFTGFQNISQILGPCTMNDKLPANIYEIQNKNVKVTGKWHAKLCQALTDEVVSVDTCKATGFKYCFDDLEQPLPMNQNYIAFSGYFFAINEVKLPVPHTLGDLHQKAGTFCDLDYDKWLETYYNNKTDNTGYGCWKINFIDRIFTTKFKFTDEGFKNVQFSQKMNGVKISWPLGYMLNATNLIANGGPKPPVLPTPLYVVLILICLGALVASIVMFRCHHNADLRKVQGLMFASSV